MVKNRIFIATIFIATIALSVTSWAEIYRWVDDKGRVHYSDRAQDRKAEDVSGSLKSVNITQGQPVQEFGAQQPKSAAELEIDHRTMAENRKREQVWQTKCDKARQQLKTIGGPVVFTREDGSVFEISEQERADKEHKLRQSIEQNCG